MLKDKSIQCPDCEGKNNICLLCSGSGNLSKYIVELISDEELQTIKKLHTKADFNEDTGETKNRTSIYFVEKHVILRILKENNPIQTRRLLIVLEHQIKEHKEN